MLGKLPGWLSLSVSTTEFKGLMRFGSSLLMRSDDTFISQDIPRNAAACDNRSDEAESQG